MPEDPSTPGPVPGDVARNLAADLALCDAATPGPWVRDPTTVYPSVRIGYPVRPPARYRITLVGSMPVSGEAGQQDEANAAMVAAAREGWPVAIRRALAAEAELARLREESRRLRWRLNHQSEDDAEACRQGRHPPDCGAAP